MTRQGWAERKARNGVQYISCITDNEVYSLIAKLLLAEHRRAVWVIKRNIANLEAIKARSFCNAEIAEAYASSTVLRDILAALQRGRE